MIPAVDVVIWFVILLVSACIAVISAYSMGLENGRYHGQVEGRYRGRDEVLTDQLRELQRPKSEPVEDDL